jgi:predicted DNA-binding protein with PD1-like motif
MMLLTTAMEQAGRLLRLFWKTGDQIVAGLTAIAKRQSLAASHFTAIGAFETALLGYFDWGKRAI